MDYVAGMSSTQGLSQRYSDDLATRASEIQNAKSTALELGSQYHEQMTNYKNMIDKPYETFGEVAGEYVATKAIGMARNKYLAYKQGKAQAQQDAEVANNNDVAPSSSSSASTETSSENIAPEPDINAGQSGTEMTEMTSMPVSEASASASATESLGTSSASSGQAVLEDGDTGARGSLSAEDVVNLTHPAESVADAPSLPDAPTLSDTPSAVADTTETATSAVEDVAKTGISTGEKVGVDVAEDVGLDATGLGEVLMVGQVADAVGHFFKNIFDPSKPKPPPPPQLPPAQQANFIQASVQQGT